MAGRAVAERGAAGSGHRPRVLWITEEPPDRALGGGNIRQAHLIEGLARRADVTLLMFGPLGDAGVRAAVAEVVEVHGVAVPAPQRRVVRRLHDLWGWLLLDFILNPLCRWLFRQEDHGLASVERDEGK